jgi:hypothetical protein
MDATPVVLALESLVGGEVTQCSANPGLSYRRPLAFGEIPEPAKAGTTIRRGTVVNSVPHGSAVTKVFAGG